MVITLQPAAGAIADRVHRFALRVYYEDTDLSGIVYHANYLKWFERARSDMLQLLGIDQRGAIERGTGFFAVAELAIRYLIPARLEDCVLIESTAEEARSASCRLRQRALRGAEVLSDARVRIGFVGADGRPRRQPEAWRRALAGLLPGTGLPT